MAGLIEEPFIGSTALADGVLNRHQLRTRYRAVLPDVYVPRQSRLTLSQRTAAAWLWSSRTAIVAGAAAAGLHGAKWIDDDTPVELVYPNARAPQGVITRRDTVFTDEVQLLAQSAGEFAVTTPARTAFDIGRRGPLRSAVARLDALARATGFTACEVSTIARRHPRTRGLRQLARALDLMDAGAESPRETYLRLLLIEAAFPRPRTQIPVVTEQDCYYLDMGWEELMVAVEYDGEHHHADPVKVAYDIRRAEILAALGWLIVRVVKEHRRAEIVWRVTQARRSRLSRLAS